MRAGLDEARCLLAQDRYDAALRMVEEKLRDEKRERERDTVENMSKKTEKT